ncbi:unnamed protein product [Citrullus colocynthis]|uniref:Uncharacterized protein n=1 Tax=Citrullus colocynthis TaxID=252529 RepID=A0ABP0Z0A5_9ROSI
MIRRSYRRGERRGKSPIWKTYRHSCSTRNREESKRERRPWLPEEQGTWRTRRASSPGVLLSSAPLLFCRFHRKDLPIPIRFDVKGIKEVGPLHFIRRHYILQ